MRRILITLLTIAALVLTLSAQQGKKKGQGGKKKQTEGEVLTQSPEGPVTVNLGQAKIAGEVTSERASDPGKQGDWPAIAYGADGSLYCAWVEWNDKDADRVMLRRRAPGGQWDAPVAIDDGNWDHYSPALARHGDGVVAIWSGQKDGNFDLFWSTVGTNGKASSPKRLTTAPNSDFNARAVSDDKGNVTVVWQSFRSGNSDVYARRLTGSSWGPETRISVSSTNDWDPAVALDRNGTAWISWDGYSTGNYDVYLRSFDGKKPTSDVISMTTEPTAQFHTSVAVDGEGKVWVAWDEADQNWGKDFSAVSAAAGSKGLHYSRNLGVRVYANGRVQEAGGDLKAILTGRMQRYAELPHLVVDGNGTLWMIFRHWTFPKPSEIYHFYATKLAGDKWSVPLRFTNSSGHNTQHASLAVAPSGEIGVAYSSDGRSEEVKPSEQYHALHYNAFVAKLEKGEGVPKVALTNAQLPAPMSRPAARPRATMAVNGKTYYLMMGDAHRHTDIRGHSGVDGSVLDTYRYAMDAAQLDWLGTSDHNEVVGGRWPDGLRDYQWWYVQKTVDLMTHAPVFVGMYSYEHSLQRPSGHRNVLFLKRGGPLRGVDREQKPDDNLPPNLWAWMKEHALTQPGQQVVLVPHTFGEVRQPLADFKWDTPRFDCLLEIYQGARSSYEAFNLPAGEKRGKSQIGETGHFAQDALTRGNVYGFVSFSDHGSTHNSWAAVWAPKEDRAGIFDGLYGRRTYAGSDEIIVKATAAGHMPGEEFTANGGAPQITASITAPNIILRVDVVRNGKYVYTTRPDSATATISYKDMEPPKGKVYYYLRVFQRDTENPSGDPEVAWTSPWYVTYQ